MAYPIPKRQAIVTAIIEQLRQINIDNGYLTNAGDVVEDWPRRFDETELAALPSQCALGVCDLTEEHDQAEPEAGGVINALPVQIRIFISAQMPAVAARQVLTDVQAAIGKNKTWGCLALNTKPLRSGFVVENNAFEITGAAVEIEVTYYTNIFNPFE